MQSLNSKYKVTVIKKIPYISELLFFLLMPGIITLLILFFFLVPSIQSSNEMNIVAVFILIPGKLQLLLLYFSLSTIVLYPLYKYIKLYQDAILTFNDNFLEIQGRRISFKIPVTNISKIYFKDPDNLIGESKEKFTIYIQEKFLNTTTLRLKDYSNADKLIQDLTDFNELRPLLAESYTASYLASED